MNCDRVLDLLSDYLDQSLAGEICEELRLHLRKCPSCSEHYESLNEAVQSLRSLPDVSPPEGILDGIHQNIDGLSPSRRSPILRVFSPWIGGVATLAAGFAAVLLLNSDSQRLKSYAPHQEVTTASSVQKVKEPMSEESLGLMSLPQEENLISEDSSPIPKSKRNTRFQDHDQNKLIADEQRNRQIPDLAGTPDKPNAFGHQDTLELSRQSRSFPGREFTRSPSPQAPSPMPAETPMSALPVSAAKPMKRKMLLAESAEMKKDIPRTMEMSSARVDFLVDKEVSASEADMSLLGARVSQSKNELFSKKSRRKRSIPERKWSFPLQSSKQLNSILDRFNLKRFEQITPKMEDADEFRQVESEGEFTSHRKFTIPCHELPCKLILDSIEKLKIFQSAAKKLDSTGDLEVWIFEGTQ